MKVYAIIPARSGSKGVIDKNIKDLNGKPLISYSIMSGLKSKMIDRVIVSTDSEQYKTISEEYGAEVPFLRPDSISGDKATDLEAMIHALDWFKENEGEEPDLIVHLRPTTPLRDPSEIDKAIEAFKNDANASALRSIHEMSESAYKSFELENNKLKTAFTKEEDIDSSNNARQGFPNTYSANGYVDVLNVKFMREQNKIHGSSVLPYVTEPVIEVDTNFDFSILEAMILKSKNIFNTLFKE
jgi:N-acylneuraminate cytidylyltransferase